MVDNFHGFFPPPDEELDKMWSSATVVLDTNALLNLYRYSVDARMDFLRALDTLRERLWIPHQVAKEFHANRLGRIHDQRNIGNELTAALDSLFGKVSASFSERTRNPFLDISELSKELETIISSLKEKIVKKHAEGLARYGIDAHKDSILAKIGELYKGRVGDSYTDEQLSSIFESGRSRYEKKIPPGYEDASKGDERAYGDLVSWFQVIDYAKSTQVDVIFITDDNKEDWWWTFNGKTIGPRPELRNEFTNKTERLFYAYRSEQFLSQLQARGLVKVPESIVDEVRDTSNIPPIQSVRSGDSLGTATEISRLDRRIHRKATLVEALQAQVHELAAQSTETRQNLTAAEAEYRFLAEMARRKVSEADLTKSPDTNSGHEGHAPTELADDLTAAAGRLTAMRNMLDSIEMRRTSLQQELQTAQRSRQMLDRRVDQASDQLTKNFTPADLKNMAALATRADDASVRRTAMLVLSLLAQATQRDDSD